MKVALFFIVPVIVMMCFVAYTHHVRNSIYWWSSHEIITHTSQEEINKEWYRLSWTRDEQGLPVTPNPLRVIALAEKMADQMDPFRAAVHMESAFYSQVKYLKKKPFHAVAYFLEARKWSHLAMNRQKYATSSIKAIDYEVLGAPDFALATVPVIGRFGFRSQALHFLMTADKVIREGDYSPLSAALIWAKMWRLTKDETYRMQIQVVGLRRDMDRNQLARVAQHLGLASVDKLFELCRI